MLITPRNLGAIIIDELRGDAIEAMFENIGPKNRLLDLGCGVKPYASVYQQYVDEAIGIDVESTKHDRSVPDKFYNGRDIPFDDRYFDIVLTSEVLEHVPDPGHFLNEINRVLVPGGYLVLTVPFMSGIHEEPYDFFFFF